MMKNLLNEDLFALAAACSYPVYVVGGCVRDFLGGLKLACCEPDIDICAPVSAGEFCALAKKSGFIVSAEYKNTGTLKLKKNGCEYEFSSFRSDLYVRGEHRPEKSLFTTDIDLDARRRDFCANAVYYDIVRGEFLDPLRGINDISLKKLRCVAPAKKVFGEDGLRLMRLARIAAETGFTPDEECIEGARKNAALISDIAAERVCAELKRIIYADGRYGVKEAHLRGIELLNEIGVLEKILPELGACKNFKAFSVAEKEVRLAALFSGLPVADVEKICARLKIPKKEGDICVRLVGARLPENYDELRLFILDNADILSELELYLKATGMGRSFNLVLEKMRRERVPLSVSDLLVRGDDIAATGVAPCDIGKTLKRLLSDCALGKVQNDKICLLEYLEKAIIKR